MGFASHFFISYCTFSGLCCLICMSAVHSVWLPDIIGLRYVFQDCMIYCLLHPTCYFPRNVTPSCGHLRSSTCWTAVVDLSWNQRSSIRYTTINNYFMPFKFLFWMSHIHFPSSSLYFMFRSNVISLLRRINVSCADRCRFLSHFLIMKKAQEITMLGACCVYVPGNILV